MVTVDPTPRSRELHCSRPRPSVTPHPNRNRLPTADSRVERLGDPNSQTDRSIEPEKVASQLACAWTWSRRTLQFVRHRPNSKARVAMITDPDYLKSAVHRFVGTRWPTQHTEMVLPER